MLQSTECKAASSPKDKRNPVGQPKFEKMVPVTQRPNSKFYKYLSSNPTLHKGIKTYEKTTKTAANQLATASTSGCGKSTANTVTKVLTCPKNTTFIIPNRYTVTTSERHLMLMKKKALENNVLITSSTGMQPAIKSLRDGHTLQVSNNMSNKVGISSLMDRPLPPESNNEATTALSTSKSIEPGTAQEIDGPHGSLRPRVAEDQSDETIVLNPITELAKTTSSSTPVSLSAELSDQCLPLNKRNFIKHNAKFVTKPCSKLAKSKLQNINEKKKTEAGLSAEKKPGMKSLEGKQNVGNGKSTANVIHKPFECSKNTPVFPGCRFIITSDGRMRVVKKTHSENKMLSTSSTGKNLRGLRSLQVSNNLCKEVLIPSFNNQALPPPPDSNNETAKTLSTAEKDWLDKAQEIDSPHGSLRPRVTEEQSDETIVLNPITELAETTSSSTPVSLSAKLSDQCLPLNNRKLRKRNTKFLTKPRAKRPKSKLLNKKLKGRLVSKSTRSSSTILSKDKKKSRPPSKTGEEVELAVKKPGVKLSRQCLSSNNKKLRKCNTKSATKPRGKLPESRLQNKKLRNRRVLKSTRSSSSILSKDKQKTRSTSETDGVEGKKDGCGKSAANMDAELIIPFSVSDAFSMLMKKICENNLLNTLCTQTSDNVPLTNEVRISGLMDHPLPPESNNEATTALSTSKSIEPGTAQEIDGPHGSLRPRVAEDQSDETIVLNPIAELAETTNSSTPVSISTELSKQSPSLNNRKLRKCNTKFATKPLAKLPKSKAKQPKSKLQNKRSKDQLVSKCIKSLSKNTQTTRPPSDTNEIQVPIKKKLDVKKKYVTRYEMLSQFRQLKSEIRKLSLSMKRELQKNKFRTHKSLLKTVATQTLVTFFETESIQQHQNILNHIPVQQIPIIEHHPGQSDPHGNEKIIENTPIDPAKSPEADSEKTVHDPHIENIITLPPAITLQNLNSNTSNNQLPIIDLTTSPPTENIVRSSIPISTSHTNDKKNQMSEWETRNQNELDVSHTTKQCFAEFDILEMPSTSKVAMLPKGCRKRKFPVEESESEDEEQLSSLKNCRSQYFCAKHPSKISGIPDSGYESCSKLQKLHPQYSYRNPSCLFPASPTNQSYDHTIDSEHCDNDRSSGETNNSTTPCANKFDVNTSNAEKSQEAGKSPPVLRRATLGPRTESFLRTKLRKTLAERGMTLNTF